MKISKGSAKIIYNDSFKDNDNHCDVDVVWYDPICLCVFLQAVYLILETRMTLMRNFHCTKNEVVH